MEGAIVRNAAEAYNVAKAALPIFGKVLQEVSLRFHSLIALSISFRHSEDSGLEVLQSDSVFADFRSHKGEKGTV